MFSGFRSNRGRHSFGYPKKSSSGKRRHTRTWVFLNRRKKKHYEPGVMRAGDSPPPMQTSIPSGYDSPDDVGVTDRMTNPSAAVMTSVKPLRVDGESDAEVIEEAVPIVHKSLPTPEPQPKIESNGYNKQRNDEKKLVNEPEDEPCIVKCVYFAQQCCECTIL